MVPEMAERMHESAIYARLGRRDGHTHTMSKVVGAVVSAPVALVSQGIVDWPEDDVRWAVLHELVPDADEHDALLQRTARLYDDGLHTVHGRPLVAQEASASALNDREERAVRRELERKDEEIVRLQRFLRSEAERRQRLERDVAELDRAAAMWINRAAASELNLDACRDASADLARRIQEVEAAMERESRAVDAIAARLRAARAESAEEKARLEALAADLQARLRAQAEELEALRRERDQIDGRRERWRQLALNNADQLRDLEEADVEEHRELRQLRDEVSSLENRERSAVFRQRSAEMRLSDAERRLRSTRRALATEREGHRAVDEALVTLTAADAVSSADDAVRDDDDDDDEAAPSAIVVGTGGPPAPPPPPSLPPPVGVHDPVRRAAKKSIKLVEEPDAKHERADLFEAIRRGMKLKPLTPGAVAAKKPEPTSLHDAMMHNLAQRIAERRAAIEASDADTDYDETDEFAAAHRMCGRRLNRYFAPQRVLRHRLYYHH